jgi:hypothetical protein
MLTLRELATELGEDRSRLRKWIIEHFGRDVLVRSRDPLGSGQLVLMLETNLAELVREKRFAWKGQGEFKADVTTGCFYAVMIVPELSELRFKFGYASSIDSRLATHRTTCPTLCLIDSWPCRFSVESVALQLVTKHSKHIGGEVFDVENYAELKLKLNQFFELIA